MLFFQRNRNGLSFSVDYQFNPIDKIVELYERLLKSEKEKNELIDKLMNERK